MSFNTAMKARPSICTPEQVEGAVEKSISGASLSAHRIGDLINNLETSSPSARKNQLSKKSLIPKAVQGLHSKDEDNPLLVAS